MSSSTSLNGSIISTAGSFTSKNILSPSNVPDSKAQIQTQTKPCERTVKYSADPIFLSDCLENVPQQPDYSIMRFVSEVAELGQCFQPSSKWSVETHIADMKALLEKLGAVLEEVRSVER
ncbi:hypothetical protein VTL71DRAFT_14742 [Oculimacula yallundae]|uniref:Uncharacterized protein n=1 Tax=Oculimacula yallundae TaxID=86028 RepID=A0ABR4CK11_9HELO